MQGVRRHYITAAAPFARERIGKAEMHKELFDLDTALSNAELAMEKLRFESCALVSELDEEQADYEKLSRWDSNRIRADIILDYAIQTGEKLKIAAENSNKLFDKLRKERDLPAGNAQAAAYKERINAAVQNMDDVKVLSFILKVIENMTDGAVERPKVSSPKASGCGSSSSGSKNG